LKQKIERYLQKTMYIKHCKKHKLSPYELHRTKKSVKYPNLYARFRFKFKYFKLKTKEGGGVMHIVFRKAYNVPKIPFEWLATQWGKIWGSPRINISEIKVRDSHKLSMYLVGQYFAKQPVIRMSYGHNWVFLGFAKSFKHLIEVYGFKRAIQIWDKRMRNNDLPFTGIQMRFRFRKLPQKRLGVIGFGRPETRQSTLDSVHFWEIFGGYFVGEARALQVSSPNSESIAHANGKQINSVKLVIMEKDGPNGQISSGRGILLTVRRWWRFLSSSPAAYK
jgi:hypothetical protein